MRGRYISEHCRNAYVKLSFLRLINYELEEMENQYFKKIIRKKIQELINGGMVLLAMIGRCREQYFGYNQFEFSLGNGEKLPYCHFGRGDMVFLSRESPFTGKPYEMMVLNKTRNTITLISRDDIPDLLEGCWRIDPSISVITHKRYVGIVYVSVIDMMSNEVYTFIVWKALLWH
jgi:hypothetical protein